MPSNKKNEEKYKAHIVDLKVKVMNSVLYRLVVYYFYMHKEMLSFMCVQQFKNKI